VVAQPDERHANRTGEHTTAVSNEEGRVYAFKRSAYKNIHFAVLGA